MASRAKQRADKAIHQARFLAAYENCADVCLACRWASVSRAAHYQWLESDPDYPARFAAAGRRSINVFLSEGVRRAVRGVEKPVFYKGKIVGTINERSDTLLLAFLKAKIPEFRESIIAGKEGAPLFPVASIEAYFSSKKNGDEGYDTLA